jgi:hypothetical protein
MSFERHIRKSLGLAVESGEISGLKINTNSTCLTDFEFDCQGWMVGLEVKEKKQHYVCKNWGLDPEEEPHLFIEDELAVRRLFLHYPACFLFVHYDSSYFLYDAFRLLTVPRHRLNRPQQNTDVLKGKWILDFRDATKVNSKRGLIENIKWILVNIPRFTGSQDQSQMTECFPGDGCPPWSAAHYFSEGSIKQGGIPRTQTHRRIDLAEK